MVELKKLILNEKKDQIEIIDQSETINEFKNSNSLSDLNNAFTNK